MAVIDVNTSRRWPWWCCTTARAPARASLAVAAAAAATFGAGGKRQSSRKLTGIPLACQHDDAATSTRRGECSCSDLSPRRFNLKDVSKRSRLRCGRGTRRSRETIQHWRHDRGALSSVPYLRRERQEFRHSPAHGRRGRHALLHKVSSLPPFGNHRALPEPASGTSCGRVRMRIASTTTERPRGSR